MRYYLSSMVCLLLLNTNIFAQEVMSCSIQPRLSTNNNERILLKLNYRAVFRNNTGKYIERPHIIFDVDNMSVFNHDKIFEIDLHPNESKDFNDWFYVIKHHGLNEDQFDKALNEANIVYRNIMKVLNKEGVKCSMITSN